MIDIEKIKHDSTGKYSPLLYKWLKSKRFINARQVFQTGSTLDRNIRNKYWKACDIIIGTDYNDGFVGGRSLKDIISERKGVKSLGYCYSVKGFNMLDITDSFWSEYEKVGRCAWDHNHEMYMIGDENRWQYISGGSQRECQWCGRVFEKIVKLKTVIEFEEIENWNEYQQSTKSSLLVPMGSMGEEV